MIDVAHAYIHHAVDQMYQSPPPLMNKPEDTYRTRRQCMHTKTNPNKPKVKCDEAEIEDSVTRGRVTRYGNSSS